ncbi:MAG: DUF2953 domain-containing protein [Clostridia bacterium]|nr:DUF2953 domain-containing protein [Clostridia bacterium]
MKIFLIILAALLLIFGILLISAVKLKIYLSESGYIVIKYLFLRFKYDIYGDNKLKRVKKSSVKKTNKKTSSKDTKKKDGYFKKIYTEEGIVEGTVKLLSTVKHIIIKILDLITECTVDNLVLDIKVASKEPAQTAICYGGVCAVAYPALGILNGIANIKKQNVNIVADYKSEKPKVLFMIIIKLRVFKAIKVAFSLIKDLIQGGI